MRDFLLRRLTLGLCSLTLIGAAHTAAAYPLDGYENTGISRLLHQRWIQ